MQLLDNERCDIVNDAISLIQKPDGLLFGTDALLLAAFINGKYKKAIELGGGSGIISMLLISRNKADSVFCIEAQAEFADLIRRNAELNSMTQELFPIHADIRDYRHEYDVDLVFTNPPYMKSNSGKQNVSDIKNIARHEIKGDIGDFLAASHRLLKYGGTFAAVYRPDRLCDLIYSMRNNGIEPKKMTLVHADEESLPSLLLVIGKRGGRCGMTVTKPFIIYADKNHKEYSEDMNYIMEHGSFPDTYKR